MFKITAANLRAIAPGAKPEIVAAMIEHQDLMANAGLLKTKTRAAHFLAQCAHETGGFTLTEESLYYTSAARIAAVWPSRFNAASAGPYVRNARKLANNVYGGRMGNNTDKVPEKFRGDAGWQYRGSGVQQATGYDNFAEVQRAIGDPVIMQPELLRAFPAALESAVVYWVNRPALIAAADANNIETVTRLINGGQIGLADRKIYLRRALAVNYGAGGTPAAPVVEYIRIGDQGPKVLHIQKRLKVHGFYEDGKLDGDFGSGTRTEVQGFQLDRGVVADGTVGPVTIDLLNADPIPVVVAPVQPAPPVAAEPVAPAVVVPAAPTPEAPASPQQPTPGLAPEPNSAEAIFAVITLAVIGLLILARKLIGRGLAAIGRLFTRKTK